MSNVRSTGKKTSNTLVRDLVNVGIFSALYIVLGFMSSSIGYIPALIFFSTASIALVTSVPIFLFYSKIERPILCCMLFCCIFGGAMLVMEFDNFMSLIYNRSDFVNPFGLILYFHSA